MLETAYREILRPLLFQFDAERVHHLAMWALKVCGRSRTALEWLRTLADSDRASDAPALSREVFGLKFRNPVGLAAGFDKDGVALPAWEALGFGFVEAGTLTPEPQTGNPRPRLFRVPESRALINRLGFNNHGAVAAARRFEALRAAGHWPRIPVGINLGKQKTTPLESAASDYARALATLHAHGDYFVLNVSSPNTPGLRGLQESDELDVLLRIVQETNHALGTSPKPLLVKIAPDLTFAQIEEILDLVTRHALAGIVATNTTVDHSLLPASAPRETGGLSGQPLRARSTAVVRFVASRTRLPVIAVGGIFDAESAREKLDAGAALVQLYTGFVYQGPTAVAKICRGLAAR
ncbi:MAG: quinone-dependent dihydroorotate dehydrogenase [Verrucomicrobia bacterium]|nr:quinone-dependent dihydroorotate dehydrogenase [Verrucomicrobiota bacterium]